jgi:replicative DNA helicase Mcm
MVEEELGNDENGLNSHQDDLLSESKEFFEINRKEIGKVAKIGGKVIEIDFEDFSGHSPDLAEYLIEKPEETIQILEIALEELEWAPNNSRARFTSLTPTQELFIRDIRSKHLSNFIAIEGIVRQSSEVRPQVTNAKFECPSCGTIISVLQIDKKFKEPSRCSCGRRGGFKEISKDMVDAQVLTIEEVSDNLRGGEQPKRMTVFLKEDLVDPRMEFRTTPGSRVKIIGVLKEIALSSSSGAILTRFDLAIEANNIIPMEEDYEDIQIDEEEERVIRELAADPELLKKVVKSIAPSIWGHENVKLALALQLFGGVKKNRSDGTAMRGDIHVLLVGDPGVAKSVMLSFISSVAPKARYLSGKSSTGAGLTATVVKDEFLKGWTLEAGAMVLANKGIVCIDEFDKMDEEDRSAMHEAMEQQTVTISKATVQATLRAQTSVLAAANPKFGRFDPSQSIPKQVNLVPSLLSRFDAIFIMKDVPNKKRDDAIAMHVLAEHQQNVTHDIIEKDLLRKYISYSKQKYNPVLTDEAIEELRSFYVGLRNQPQFGDSPNRPIPIGARQLEALVRLSEAHARMKLKKEVGKEDAKIAIDLVKGYLMEVGYDEETKTIDIDKISGNPASQRNKIGIVRDAVEALENKLGKLIPLEELSKALKDKMSEEDLDEAVGKLLKAGDLFRPKRGYIQQM